MLTYAFLTNYDGSVGRKWATAIYFRLGRRVKFLVNHLAGTAFHAVRLGDFPTIDVVPLSRSSVSHVARLAYFLKGRCHSKANGTDTLVGNSTGFPTNYERLHD